MRHTPKCILCVIVCVAGCQEQSSTPLSRSSVSSPDSVGTQDSPDEIPNEFEVLRESERVPDAAVEELVEPGFDFGGPTTAQLPEEVNGLRGFSREPRANAAPADSNAPRTTSRWPTNAPAPKSAMAGSKTAAIPRAQRVARQVTTIRVFYGTDRAATGSRVPNEFFGSDHGRLSVGFCDVSIPPNHKTGELESPSIWRLEFRENEKRHVMLRSVAPVSSSEFFTKLRSAVDQSTQNRSGAEQGGELFIFVHGFNVSFKDAARRTAQIAHDLAFHGPPVMFSWPSRGKTSIGSYRADARAAEWCDEHAMDFLTAIARNSGASRIHVIAHSMGNRVVAGALRRLAWHKESAPHFNQVILTAPDIDAETFRISIAPRINSMADRFTVYASSDDVALKAAARLNSWGPRLGQAGEELTTFPKFPSIDVIDATSVDTSLFSTNHSYFASSRTVLRDMRLVLSGRPARARGLKTLINRVAWSISAPVEKIASDLGDEF